VRAFDVRLVRSAVAAGAIVGSVMVSSVAVATDESPPIDESVAVLPVEVGVPTPTDPLSTDPPLVDLGDVTSIVIEVPSDLPDSTAVIELVVVDVTESGTGSDAIESESTETESTETESTETESTETESTETESSLPESTALPPGEADAEMRSAPVATSLAQASVEGDHDDGSEHDGGKVGEGTPYLMTFEVDWLDPNGMPIGDLDRSSFRLSADSSTGMGPTSATCTYLAANDALQCVFDGAGHDSGSEGLIIPGSKTATYEVTVAWSSTDWTIAGANDGASSARDLCPRGGGDDHGDGGDDHGDGGDGKNEGRRTVSCLHTVTMRQIALPADPPAVEPGLEATPPAVSPTGVASSPVAQSAAAAPRSLPATGSSISMTVLMAGTLFTMGLALTRLTRRTS